MRRAANRRDDSVDDDRGESDLPVILFPRFGLLHNLIGKVEQVETLRSARVFDALEPGTCDLSSVPSLQNAKISSLFHDGKMTSIHVPVEHDPISDAHDTVLRLVQRRELRFDSVVGESHLADDRAKCVGLNETSDYRYTDSEQLRSFT